jgi:serine/threonine-protein kinase
VSEGTPGAAAPEGPPDVSALVGTVLAGRYRIVQKLGEGAMGAVYIGEHLRIGRRDAIKVLRDSLSADPEAMARFARGARNVSLIQHPNVCTVYDFGDLEDGRRFMAMELVPGETLQDLLQREGRLPAARAVSIAVQIAGALQAAHDAGIVHRDLKPGNVMVSPGRGGADVVKVVDFDIAKGSSDGAPGDVTRLGFVIGTPEYMSPEQLLGMPLDGRSDVYSLGVVLFRMLAGALPFRANDTQELMVQRLTGAPLRLDEVSPALPPMPAMQAALDHALQRRAEDRTAGAAEFAEAITQALAESPASAPFAIVAPPVAGPGAEWSPQTRGGVPATVLTADHAPHHAAPAEEPRRRMPSFVRPGLVALAVALVIGAGWGVSRAVGPSDPAPAGPLAGATEAPEKVVVTTPPPLPIDTADRTAPIPVDSSALPPGTRMAAVEEKPKEQRAARVTSPSQRTGAAAPAVVEQPKRLPRETRPPPPDAGATTRGLMRQLETADSEADLRRISEVARRVWNRPDTEPRHRATAAFVAGSALSQLGDRDGCIRWAENSLSIRPDSPGAQTLLAACRELAP